MIDIKKVLTEHKIFWRGSGEGCAKGNIITHCPWCGSEDRSEHLGIRLADGYFGCWRNEKHRGKNLYRLLSSLGISIAEERSGTLTSLANRTFFNPKAKYEEKSQKEFKVMELPTSFVKLDDSILSKPYLSYITKRGFDNPLKFSGTYDLRRDYENGRWSNRLIFPIWVNKYVCWTGRAINNASLRYLSSSEKENTISIKSCIYNYNELKLTSGETLVITEGPLDALKVDWYLKPEARATCLFGLSFIEPQLKLLEQVCYNFNNILIGFDKGALPQSLTLVKRLRKFSPIIIQVPSKDFGEMEPEVIRATIRKYV